MTHSCLHDEASLTVLYSDSPLSKQQDGGYAWHIFEDIDNGLMGGPLMHVIISRPHTPSTHCSFILCKKVLRGTGCSEQCSG